MSSFEGLRGIAAFSVVIAHLSGTFYATSSTDLRTFFSFLPHFASSSLVAFMEGLYCGTFAVWLFWIMSGFVLSLQFFLRVHQAPSERAHDYLEDAFLRRYPRLLIPVLASVAFAYVLLAFHLMQNVQLAQTLGEPYASGWLGSWYKFPASALGALQSAVWNVFFQYDGNITYNNVLWTMQYEFYGSIFLFAFLGLLGHRICRFLIYPLIALTTFKLNLIWLDAFVAGIGLCDLFVNRTRLFPTITNSNLPIMHFFRNSSLLTMVLWVLIFTGVGCLHNGEWRIRHLGCLYLMLGVGAVTLTLVSRLTQRILTSRIPQFLGRISFGLYLIHIPVICSFSCWFYLATFTSLGSSVSAFIASALSVILSVFLDYLLYVFADGPGIRLARSFSQLVMNTAKSIHQPNPAVEDKTK